MGWFIEKLGGYGFIWVRVGRWSNGWQQLRLQLRLRLQLQFLGWMDGGWRGTCMAAKNRPGISDRGYVGGRWGQTIYPNGI